MRYKLSQRRGVQRVQGSVWDPRESLEVQKERESRREDNQRERFRRNHRGQGAWLKLKQIWAGWGARWSLNAREEWVNHKKVQLNRRGSFPKFKGWCQRGVRGIKMRMEVQRERESRKGEFQWSDWRENNQQWSARLGLKRGWTRRGARWSFGGQGVQVKKWELEYRCLKTNTLTKVQINFP